MGMVSMKVGNDDSYTQVAPNPYGYGLCICLSEEQVEALGLDKNPPAAGSTVVIQAVALVRRVTQESDPAEEVAEGESPDDIDVSLELQITDMEVTTGQQRSSAQSASLLYGGGDG